MTKLTSKLLPAIIVAFLTIAGSGSYAAPGKSEGAGGWEPSADHVESVVISLKTDPLDDPEPACVAIQIGINLLLDTIANIPVTPADEVILFLTLDGVEIVRPDGGALAVECDAPADPPTIEDLLEGFIGLGGEIVVCPLCAGSRGIVDPTYGTLGDGVAIHELFLYADKVIDF